MDIDHYLIDQAGFDWQVLLQGWAEILPATFTIWLVTRFGDVFLISEDRSVQHLDVGLGRLQQVAKTREQFADLMDVPENADDWLMIPLVDQCVESGIALAPGQCYGFKTSPLFGGEYRPENVYSIDLAKYYSYLADIFLQTKDLQDGTRVRLLVRPDPPGR